MKLMHNLTPNPCPFFIHTFFMMRWAAFRAWASIWMNMVYHMAVCDLWHQNFPLCSCSAIQHYHKTWNFFDSSVIIRIGKILVTWHTCPTQHSLQVTSSIHLILNSRTKINQCLTEGNRKKLFQACLGFHFLLFAILQWNLKYGLIPSYFQNGKQEITTYKCTWTTGT